MIFNRHGQPIFFNFFKKNKKYWRFFRIQVLRFPLNRTVMLITSAGCITCKITKATNNFLYCENVIYDNIDLKNVYVDRNSVVAFTNIEENKEESLENKIQKVGKIIQFKLLQK